MFAQRVILGLRTLWWLSLLVHATCIILVVGRALGLTPWLTPTKELELLLWAGVLLGWVPLLVLPMVTWIYRQRTLSKLDKLDFAICVRCGYDLSRGDSFGPCPECGHGYALDQQRLAWRRIGFDPDRAVGYPPPRPLRRRMGW
jgi:hypothetical protein